MKYTRGTIIQFKDEKYLIEKQKWNKEYAKIVADKIGIITESKMLRYEIRLYEDECIEAVANEDSVFIPNGYIVKQK